MMVRDFDSCQVTLVEESIENSYFDVPLKRTKMLFMDGAHKELNEIAVGCVDKKLFFNLLNKKTPLHFENLYFPDLSLSEYRESIKSDSVTVLPEISFTNCYFQATNGNVIDFSHVIFENVSFHGSMFLNDVTFASSRFTGEDVSFDYCLFSENVNFNETHLSSAHLSFKNAIFRGKEKKFEHVHFGSGDKIFQNTEFGDGEVSFYGSDFGLGIVSFKVSRFGKGRKNFDHTRFSNEEVIFERTNFGEGNISFKSAVFAKCRIDFTRSVFDEGQKIFVNTDFGKGSVSFVNTSFGNGKVSFRSAQFGGEIADFHYAVFGVGDIVFERTNFENTYTDFRSVRFNEGDISFDRAIFGNHDIDFEASECSGNLKFVQTEFGTGKLNFHMAEFDKADISFEYISFNNSNVNFNLARVRNLTMKSCEFNKYFDLRLARCEKLDFSESIIRDIIDISPHENTFNIESIDFSGLILLGRIYIDWNTSLINKRIHNLNTDPRNKSEQFRMLKQNYYTIGNYEYEDKAYIEFKRTEMIADLQQSLHENPYTGPFAYVKYGFKWLILDKTGKFATNPVRVLLSMFIIFFIFSFVYFLLAVFTNSAITTGISNPEKLSTFALSFYYSGITFFTIGYGDYYPEGYIRWFAIVEGFLGVFMMSYLAVAFVRKILR